MKILQYPLVAIICLLFTFHSLPLHAQEAGKSQEQLATNTTDTATINTESVWYEAKALLPAQVFLPPESDSSRAHTLILALHGIGGNAEQLQNTAEALAADGFVVALPQGAYPTLAEGKLGYDWALWLRRDEAMAIRATELVLSDQVPTLVADLRQRYQIDHIYLLGFSQGAVTAMITAFNSGDLFDGVVSFGAPVFDISWITGEALEASRGVRVMLLHGKDDPHARFMVSELTRDALKEAGYDVTFRPFDGGHTVPEDQLGFVTEWIRYVNPEKEE